MNNSKLNVVLHRDGDRESVTLDQDKCLIRTVKGDHKIDCCAIFNGPYGTALRSYTDSVLVNGEPTVARWLSAGDEIQLPCSTRIEVRAATRVRTTMSQSTNSQSTNSQSTNPVANPAAKPATSPVANQRSVSENVASSLDSVEAILAPELQAPVVPVAPVAPVPAANTKSTPVKADEAEQEERFHSPFSADLPEVAASKPVPQSVVAPEEKPAAPVADEPAANDLESIFAKMGLANVGSIANPGAAEETSATTETNVAPKPVVAPAAPTAEVQSVQNVPAAPVQKPQTQKPQVDANASASAELASIFADVPAAAAPTPPVAPAVPATTPSVKPVATVAPTAEVQGVQNVPAAPVQKPQTQKPQADANASASAELASIFADVPAAAAPTTPVAPVVPTAATPSIEPVATVEISAPASSETVDQPVVDPLSELPDDLRNQLNSLVSSLETETSAPAPANNESVLEKLAPTAAAATAAAAVAAAIPTISDLVKPQPAQQQSNAGATEAATPVRDESISSMFEDVMRSIQDQSNPTEEAPVAKPAVENVAAPASPAQTPSPVQATAVQQPKSPVASEAPVAAPQPAESQPAQLKPKPKSQSVADILGAMGMEVPGDDEVEVKKPKTPAPAAKAPAPVAQTPIQTPEPAQTPSTPPAQVFADVQPTSAAPEAGDTGSEADDDIQAYMNSLLNRAAPEPQTASPAPTTEAPIETKIQPSSFVSPPAQPEAEEVQAVLSAEEFVPSHKPSRPQNYDTLREIANTSSRSAIHSSNKRAKKESVSMKIVFGLIALLLAGATIWIGQYIIAGVFLSVAAMCIVSCFLSIESSGKQKVDATMDRAGG